MKANDEANSEASALAFLLIFYLTIVCGIFSHVNIFYGILIQIVLLF